METIVITILSLLSLITISVFAFVLAKKVNFPYTLFLVFLGTILAIINKFGFLTILGEFKLTPEILFYVFLPTLLFEAGYNIKISGFLASVRGIFSLAIFGLIISTLIIGFGLSFILGLFGIDIPLIISLLFGAIISATDPVAVIALFKEYSAPKRLTLIFEGESLFNDGTAVAMFLVILGVISESAGVLSTGAVVKGVGVFISMLILGMLFGAFMGLIFSKLLEYTKNENLQITLSLVVAHLTFLLSDIMYEHYGIYISAIVATVSASLIVGNYGRYKLTPRVEKYMDHFWDYFAFIANSLVFILLGFLLVNIKVNSWEAVLIILVAILLAMFARLVSVFISLYPLRFQKREKEIPNSWKLLLSWGSLRGALAITMVLMIPDNLTLDGWNLEMSIKEFITLVVVASIYFTLFVKGMSIGWLIKKLKISKVGTFEKMEYLIGKAMLNFKMIEKLQFDFENGQIERKEYQKLFNEMKDKVEKYKKLISEYEDEHNDFVKKNIMHFIIGIENKVLFNLYSNNEITERGYKKFSHKLEMKQYYLDHHGELKSFEEIIFHHLIDDTFRKIEVLFKKQYMDIHDKYYYYMALKESLMKVINALNDLKETGIFENEEVIDEFIQEYQKYFKAIEEKKNILVKKHKSLTTDKNNYIQMRVEHEEIEILEELNDNGLISRKIMELLKKEI